MATNKNVFKVFKVRNKLGMQDPDMPGTRYHTTIFVETERHGDGWTHHVTGDIVNGMIYERREESRPEDSPSYHDKEYIGTIDADAYPENIDNICRAYPPPRPQKAFNKATLRTEPVKADGTFYESWETRKLLKKCTEWIEEDILPALKRGAILFGH